jgi:hypothetical protein
MSLWSMSRLWKLVSQPEPVLLTQDAEVNNAVVLFGNKANMKISWVWQVNQLTI